MTLWLYGTSMTLKTLLGLPSPLSHWFSGSDPLRPWRCRLAARVLADRDLLPAHAERHREVRHAPAV